MNQEFREETAAFRKTFFGQLKNILALLCLPVGLFFWFRDRNLTLTIPIALMSPLAVNLPAFLYKKIGWLHEQYNIKLMKIYEFLVILMLTLSISGSAYLFYLPYQFDIVVHYTENFIFAFLLILAVNIFRHHCGRPGFSPRKAAWLIILTGIAMGIVWEVYQYGCDHLFHTKMAFDSYQSWLEDTVTDILGGQLGLLVFTPLIILPFWETINGFIRREHSHDTPS